MSDSPLLKKTKDDLAVIAQMMGLLTPKDTSRMTKAQLLAFLQKVEDEANAVETADSAVEVPAEEPAPEKKKRVGRPRKSVMIADEPTVEETPKEDVKQEKVSDTSPDAKDEAKEEKEDAKAEEAPPKRRGRPRKTETKKEKAKDEPTEEKKPAKRRTSTKKTKAKEETAEEKASDEEVEVKKVANTSDTGKDDIEASTEEEVVSDVADSETENGADADLEEKSDASEKESAPADHKEKEKSEKESKPQEIISGILEIMPDGYGFLRIENYLQGNNDIYVPPQYIRRFGLRSGDLVTGPCRQQRDSDRYRALYYIKEVNGMSPDKMMRRPHFDRLTPIYPNERYVLETTRNELSTRIIDLVSPIGKGQRGMIVSPPKAGKTILLQKIANAISINNPDAKLIVLLIDERPEEVTDMQRSINGEVVYSTFDKTPENHVKVTELVLERAMRLVELKQDVVILLDSITRMGRAYNLTITPTGRTLSGGLDPGALYGPKRFFGAARNIEHGGSLTIIATALIETGSRMDEVIFEEFKGTGNMEVLLDRKLSEKRIFPAIDITRSSTRREELLLSSKELDSIWAIRKAFGQLDTAAVTETIINLLLKTRDNSQFIQSVNVSFNDRNLYEAMRGSTGKQHGNAAQS